MGRQTQMRLTSISALKEKPQMEIKELSFMENLSDNGKEIYAKDTVVGGHSYGYSYDFHSYFSHPLLDKLKNFDFGKITIEVIKPKPKPKPEPEPELVITFAEARAPESTTARER